jgi:hypothetical protein
MSVNLLFAFLKNDKSARFFLYILKYIEFLPPKNIFYAF